MSPSIQAWLSDSSGRRLERLADTAMATDREGVENRVLNLHRDTTFQQLEGFGAALTESAAVALESLAPGLRAEALEASFGPAGNRLSLCRIPMGSCDFSLGNYSQLEDPSAGLEAFSMARDLERLVPLARDASAAARGGLKAIVSPWSPPAWMKDTGRMDGGGRLLPGWRATWAGCFALFVKALESEGIPVWAVTVQNEPKATQTWDSCVWTAEEERDFIRDHLGPELDRAGVGHVRILGWDHNKERLWERARILLQEEAPGRKVDGMAFHWYSGDHFEALDLLSRSRPGLLLVGTEACQEGGRHPGSWAVVERYAHDIIGDLQGGAHAWIDWNLALDAKGGPNHASNFCDSPLVADDKKNELVYDSAWYAVGHFSRFIRPGARRLGLSRWTAGLEATAWLNPEGSLALVVLNRGVESLPFVLRDGERIANLESPARSILTAILPG